VLCIAIKIRVRNLSHKFVKFVFYEKRVYATKSPIRRSWSVASHHYQGYRTPKDIPRFRAKVVSDFRKLDRYLYCGHSRLVGKHASNWQDVSYILHQFGKSKPACSMPNVCKNTTTRLRRTSAVDGTCYDAIILDRHTVRDARRHQVFRAPAQSVCI
jgi:hypothetical protein